MNRDDDPTVRWLSPDDHDAIRDRLCHLRSDDDRPRLDELLQAIDVNLLLDEGQGLTTSDLIDGLRIIPDERVRLELRERQLLEAALDRGETWESLAKQLGWRSRQALQQRYRRLGGTRTWPTRRAAETPWFGQLLRWHRSPRGWAADHAGRTYEIVKLDRQAADEQGGGLRPGWHFATHPDEPDDPTDRAAAFGPDLGSTLPRAKMLAEAWLTTSPDDRRPHADAPSLLLTLTGVGAVFAAGTTRLSAWVDADDQRRIVIVPTGSEDPLATITPQFGTGEGGRVAITWDAALTNGTALASTPTWREAAAAVAAAVATDTSEDR